MIGQTVSHYRILSQIGSGGMGVVYRAIDARLGREVAVKFLSKELSQNRAAINRFKREARTASSLDHPNICVVHDIGEHDGRPFIVMPLLRGQSLKELVASRRLAASDVLDYGIQISDALETAHSHGILHRDIKPANVFVTERNEPKLLDFGLAKLAAPIRSHRSIAATTTTERSKLTATDFETGPGSRLGTVAYMSPEQALGDELDARSDTFSLGVTLYEMATGTLPFTGPTPVAVFNAIITQTPIAPSTINADLPSDLDQLLAKALDKDRTLRYQTASDLLVDLKRVRRRLRERVSPAATSASGRVIASLQFDGVPQRPVFPTEAINPSSLTLDRAPVDEIIEMIVNEDRKVVTAVHLEKNRIAQAIEMIIDGLQNGGRLVFVGAGTSGRLGVVEATEMPPTFSTSPRLVQAVMAGGNEAFFSAKEAVETEDHYDAGASSVMKMRVSKKDVVVGVSAGGKTPFVRGALARSAKVGAKTIFITCQPSSEFQTSVDLTIAPAVGPEIIAGSTRLKAGTATKMVLNMLTTISMIRMGKTYGNLMVDVQAGSEKLKDRARRILSIVTGMSYNEAGDLLRQARWNVKAAIVMQKTGFSYARAIQRLRKAGGSVREATGVDIETRLRELLQADQVVNAQL